MNWPDPVRILLVGDDFVARVELASLLNSNADLRVVGEASTGREAIAQFERQHPDVTLMDFRISGSDAVDCTQAICRTFPDARVVVLTSWFQGETVRNALNAGARACLQNNRQSVPSTVRAVHAGEYQFPPEFASRLLAQETANTLNPCEIALLRLIARGRSNQEIAKLRGVNEETIKIHFASILAKLQNPDEGGDRVSVTNPSKVAFAC